MKRTAILIFILAAFTFSAENSVGVMPFTNGSIAEKESMEPLRKGLAQMMTTELSKIEALKIIERTDLETVIKELGLSMSGMVDESSLQEAGKLLGADLLMLGTFNNSFGGKIRIDARLVKVETGENLKAEEVTGKTKHLFKLVSKLSFKIADELDISLSGKEKKNLKKSENEDFNALMYFSKGLEAEDEGNYEKARDMYKKALKENKDYKSARKRFEAVSGKISE